MKSVYILLQDERILGVYSSLKLAEEKWKIIQLGNGKIIHVNIDSEPFYSIRGFKQL